MTDTKANILIVDDRTDKLLALEAVLEELDQNIVTASSGREALRCVLANDFAVILLDVNMPGMDGFETATLIRQRTSSRHTPIIFITAFGDEMHAARGYSLGAVDYILAPVMPEVLRTKVAVFVELFVKTQQTQRQAESLRRRAVQLQKLAAASLAINSALSTDQMLRMITDSARDIVGSHQAITLYAAGPALTPAGKTQAVTSFSDKYASWRDRAIPAEAMAAPMAQSRTPIRLGSAELQDQPDWELFKSLEIPPLTGGLLAAPLTGRDGTNLGVIYLSDRYHGEFTRDDEAVVVQLAQMGSIALENTIYAQERETNRLKDEFLATLSHELRTPLNAIVGWTQLLKMEHLEGEVAHGLEVIDRNARAQTKLIEDLLDVSRITTGKLRLSMKRSVFGPVVQAAIDALRPAVTARQIEFETSLSEEDAPILIDADRMQQVVWNLLSNAVKFTPNGGRISVGLKRDNDELVLRVTDSGQGIDQKFLPFVFDRFRQADSTSTRRQGGLGIGLTIVRHIVEHHGGRVMAESDGVGRGSTFSVILPFSGPVAIVPTGPALSAESQQSRDALVDQLIAGRRILLVDDDADARDVMATTLRRAGAHVRVAGSAADALTELDSAWPDILISDIAMPMQDGYELVRTVRQRCRRESRELPAIALTAYAREEDRALALSAGFHAHLTKPVNPSDLLAQIARLTPATVVREPVMKLA